LVEAMPLASRAQVPDSAPEYRVSTQAPPQDKPKTWFWLLKIEFMEKR